MRRGARSRARIATLLLCASLALPTAAVANEGPSVGSKIFDCAVMRPFGLIGTIVGGILFVPAAALASAVILVPPTVLFERRDRVRVAESFNTAWEHFVAAQVEYTFTRPLGEF